MSGSGSAVAQRMTRGVAGVVVAAALAACGADTPRITEARGEPTSSRLVLTADTCNAHPSASVEESPEEVRVLLRASRSWGDADCEDSVVVTLAAPLGSRTVVDAATDERVEVLPPG